MQSFLKYFFYVNILAIISVIASTIGDASFPVWGILYGFAPLGVVNLVLVSIIKATKLTQKYHIPQYIVRRLLIIGSIEILVGLGLFIVFVISLQNFSLI